MALAMIFAAVRLVWDAAVGPLLDPYLLHRPLAPDEKDKIGLIFAIAYLLIVAPVVVFVGAYPILVVLNPLLRFVESHRRLLLGRAAWAFCVAAAIVYYDVVWRYLAYPVAQTLGIWVFSVVAFASALWWLGQMRRSGRVTSDV